MIIIPNPVGLPTTGRADVTAHCRKRKTLLAVGRLDAGKDHATLIDAFAKIAERTPDWDLRIAGEGVLRPELEEQIARLGLKDRISLPGAIKEISAEYRSAQLFVIPSRYESFSLTTAEALAHRLPVIAFSECPAIAQWIEPDRNGILVDPSGDRTESLAEALLPLMRQEHLREQLTGGSVLLEEYRLDPLLDRWEQAFFALGVLPSTSTIKWLSSSTSGRPKQGAPTLQRAD